MQLANGRDVICCGLVLLDSRMYTVAVHCLCIVYTERVSLYNSQSPGVSESEAHLVYSYYG